MYKTIEEGLEVYKKEFKVYAEWLKPIVDYLRDTHKARVTSQTLITKMSKHDWSQHLAWMAKLASLEKALGLNEKDIEAAAKEVGYLDINWG